jgi:hypothetical protein
MKKHLYLLIVTVLLLSFAGCGKYADGPAVSLRTKKARLDGNWTMVVIYNNGVDVTANYPDDTGYRIDKNGGLVKIANATETAGSWEFNEDKKEIRITLATSPTPYVWEILRLTNNHLWLKRTVPKPDPNELPDTIEEHYEVKK